MRIKLGFYSFGKCLACTAALLGYAIGSSANAAIISPFQSVPINPDTTRTDSFQAGWGFSANPSGTKQVNQLGFWVSPADSLNTGVLAISHDVALFHYNYNGT